MQAQAVVPPALEGRPPATRRSKKILAVTEEEYEESKRVNLNDSEPV